MEKNINKSILDRKLLIYTVTGGALLGGAPGVYGTVQTRTINATYNAGTGVHNLDIDNDGNDDFSLESTYTSSDHYKALLNIISFSNNLILGQGGNGQTAIFNSSSNIPYTNVNWGNATRLRQYDAPSSLSAGVDLGYWEGAVEKYAPVKFYISGQVHCGYVKLSVDANMNITLHSVAWEDQPNTDITAGALPVELVSFYAEQVENTVELSWKTATEVNNYGFDVERQKSEAGSQSVEWEKIGFVNGNGVSNSPHQYSFTDSNLPSSDKASYRLKQIDNDGSVNYSNVVTIALEPVISAEDGVNNKFELQQNYPNPFNPTTRINFSIPESNNVTIKVYNILGEHVTTLIDKRLAAGNHEVNFDATNLANGIYFYQLTAGSYTVTKKMLLMK